MKILDEEAKKKQELATCRANLRAVKDWLDDKHDQLDAERRDPQDLRAEQERLEVSSAQST